MNCGAAALAYSWWLGKRRGYGTQELAYKPNDVGAVVLGSSLLLLGYECIDVYLNFTHLHPADGLASMAAPRSPPIFEPLKRSMSLSSLLPWVD